MTTADSAAAIYSLWLTGLCFLALIRVRLVPKVEPLGLLLQVFYRLDVLPVTKPQHQSTELK